MLFNTLAAEVHLVIVMAQLTFMTKYDGNVDLLPKIKDGTFLPKITWNMYASYRFY